jgi:hypothetical protein
MRPTASPAAARYFLGANCLGRRVAPGQSYDSWFIPLERLPKPKKKAERNSVMLAQSGAFMITRISQNPWLDPRYMLALGNQTDLTHGDMLAWFAELPEIETIGIYIEGFKDGRRPRFRPRRAQGGGQGQGRGGLQVRQDRARHGRRLWAIQRRSPVARCCSTSVVRHAGAIVADDFNASTTCSTSPARLHGKAIGGRRLGAISGAGFEAVGMADSIEIRKASPWKWVRWKPPTVTRVEDILKAKKLDALVEVRQSRSTSTRAPTTRPTCRSSRPSCSRPEHRRRSGRPRPHGALGSRARIEQAAPGLRRHRPEEHGAPDAAAGRAQRQKPVIGIVDGGSLYDAMSARLMDQGVCVFRNCARGTKALVRYVEARLNADALRAAPVEALNQHTKEETP